MIQQGTIGWLEFSPSKGHEQAGRRPALIVSADLFNSSRGGIAWAIPITSNLKGPDKVQVPEGLPVSGVFILSQIKTVDLKTRNFEPICVLNEDFLAENILGRLIAVLTG